MNIKKQHLDAIHFLLDRPWTERNRQELARDLGVQERTILLWLRNKDFRAAYDQALQEFTRQVEADPQLPFVNKALRIRELHRLYGEIPDSAIEKFIHAQGRVYDPETKTMIEVDAQIIDTDGSIVEDEKGNPVSVLAVRKLNVGEKREILKQIRDEMEPRILRLGMGKKNADGSSEVVFVETGLTGENEIPWGDAGARLPEVEDRDV